MARDQEALSKLHAPYNFVPLSSLVHTAWGPTPSQDVPFRDGISGTLSLALTADSPLLVSGNDTGAKDEGEEGEEKRFYCLPDGTHAIPGSSLRGMIRNVVEIISFSRFQLVDDRRFGLRDLTGAARLDYQGKFTETVGPRTYRARSKAGWLTNDEAAGWQIEPCNYARIDHSQFRQLSARFYATLESLKRKPKQDERTAENIYDAWEAAMGKIRPLPFEVEVDSVPHRHSPGHLDYREAFVPGHVRAGARTREEQGTLVFTGLPSAKKHMEFVFLQGEAGKPHPIESKVWQGFLDVHQSQEKSSPTWDFWRNQYNKGEISRIPVFYLESDNGQIYALGLALMFKLAQDCSTHEMIRTTSKDHSPDKSKLDLAERLFGRIDEEGDGSLKGRVSFGVARLIGDFEVERKDSTILGAPKPSYFPAYVRQLDFADGDGSALAFTEKSNGRREFAQYRTYMSWNDRCETLRGWKRYPARGGGRYDPPRLNSSQAQNKKVHVKLAPIYRNSGLRFESVMRFHNLQPAELGALVWALEWGGNTHLRHGLGMGKPFGWGQAVIRIERDHPRTMLRSNKPQAAPPSLDKCRADFIAEMDKWLKSRGQMGGWETCLQIRRLKAMANPGNAARNGPLAYMELDPDAKVNQFLQAKKDGLVLREYWDETDQQSFDDWKANRRKNPPAAIPPPTAMKGMGPSPEMAGRASGGRPRTSLGARSSPSLFRRGERVLNIEESEEVVVVSDQADPSSFVRVRYDDGMEDDIAPHVLKRG